MSLCDDIAAYRPRGCATCNWYRELPEKEQDAFDAWVGNFRRAPRAYPLAHLQEFCTQYGLQTNPRSFREHVQLHLAQLKPLTLLNDDTV